MKPKSTYARRVPALGALLFFLATICATSLSAQTLTTGDVAGVVKDASGAVVPSAAVTLRNTETNEVRTVNTGASGEYRFSLLKPGDYTISAQTSGLKSNAANFTVLVGQTQNVNLTVNVTGTQQTVEVQAGAEILQTQNANLETSYTTSQIVNLPMAGGDLTTLAMTAPGIRVNVTGGSGNMNANGIPGSSVLFTLNGSDEMDPYNNLNNSGASNNLLGANEVAEASVVLNSYSAQYGRMAGGQVILVGKSGTNAFHGNLFYNFNGQYLNGNDFFNNATDTPRGRSDAHQFGGSFGGPIKKNKLFFFGDYEAMRYVLPAAGVISLPSQQLEQYTLAHVPAASLPLYQDYFGLVNGAPGINRAVPVTNGTGPLQDNNGTLGCGTGSLPGTPAPGGGIFGVNVPCAVAFGTNNTQLNTEQLITGRVDYNMTDKQKIFFRYNYDGGLQATGTSPIAPEFNALSHQPQDTGNFNYTYVITPTIVNNLVGSAFWYSALFGVANFPQTATAMPEAFVFNDGGANGGGFATVGDAAYPNGLPVGRDIGHGELMDDFSWTHNNHTIRVGAAVRYDRMTYSVIAENSIVGRYSFNDLADFANGALNANNANLGSNFAQSFPRYNAVHMRVPSEDLYISDDWAVTPRLKLTLGFRVENDGNPTCIENCFVQLSQPFNSPGYQANVNTPYNATEMTGLNSGFYKVQSWIPEPRFGLAWQPFGNGKTVVRAGGGLFSTNFTTSTATSFSNQGPNVYTPSGLTFGTVGLAADPSSSTYAAIAANSAFQSGFAAGYTLGQIRSALSPIPFSLPSFTSAPALYKAPHDIEWSFEIEHTITPHNVLTATYVGNHGYDLAESYDLNAYTNASGVARYGGGFAGLPTAPIDPRFLSVTQLENNGISNYNGLTVQFRHQFSYGLTGQIHYTWSHALDTVGWYNPYSIAAGYGNAPFDSRHQFSADFLWQEPHKFENGVAKRVLSGWNLSGKFYLYSGAPFSVTDTKIPAQINSAGGIGTVLADVVNPAALSAGCGGSAVNSPCLSRSSFATYSATSGVSAPIQTDWGNIAPDSFYGPGYFDIDAQLTRNFKLTEKMALTLGMSGYNILNHPNFAKPNSSLSGSGFGLITSDLSPPTSIYGSFQGATVSGRVLVLMGRFTF